MIFAAILMWGIATLWVSGRWALAVFQGALFTLAAVRVARGGRGHLIKSLLKRQAKPPTPRVGQAVSPAKGLLNQAPGGLLVMCAAWGMAQIATGWTVEPSRTVEAVLAWIANAAAFYLALNALSQPETRERFLQGVLLFAMVLSMVAIFTMLTSPPGLVFWSFDSGSELSTLGPFVYRNQYAAFVEAVLPLALARAILDKQRWLVYTLASAVLFGSVVAAGSRAGAILCAAEIVFVPLVVFARRMISWRTLTRALMGSLAAMVLLTAIVGWEFIWSRLQEPNPYSLRRDLVISSLEMIRDRPWTGFGLGAWSSAYPAYAHFDDGRFVNQAHNDWVQWAAEGGLPFLAMMLAIGLWSIRPALRSLWGIGMLAVFVHCLVDYPMQQRPALAAFFFAMLGAIAADANTTERVGR